MKVINFFGGPGCGKSTMAAALFAEMKMKGHNCELVTEYAKQVVWRQNEHILKDQIYIFGKQQHKIWVLQDQVDYVITDSPIFLSLVYGPAYPQSFLHLVLDTFNSYTNINIVLKREKEYNPKGRTQTHDEAKAIDFQTAALLNVHRIPYKVFPGTLQSLPAIYESVREFV